MQAYWTRVAVLSIAGYLGSLAVVDACSTSDRYLRPSNYELVKGAGAIVRAVAVDTLQQFIGYGSSLESDERIPLYSGSVRFRVIEVLKGSDRIESITAGGDSYTPDEKWEPNSSFRYARGPRYGGPCNTDWYTIGSQYLLFLDSGRNNVWFVSGPPFTRIAEPVADTNDPWYRTVRHYIQAERTGNYEQSKERLKWLRDAAQRQVDSIEYPRQMVEDIDRHFSEPHGMKSYADLIDLLARRREGEDTLSILRVLRGSGRSDTLSVLWAIANGGHPEGAEFIRQLLDRRTWIRYSEPMMAYLTEQHDTSMIRPMIAQYRKLSRSEEAQWEVLKYLRSNAGAAHRNEMVAFLLRSDTTVALALAPWFIEHPHPDATARLRRLRAKRRFGFDPIHSTLAELGDEDVIRAALAHQRDRGVYGLGPYPAYYILAQSTHPLADSAFAAVLASRDATLLEYITQGLGYTRGAHVWPRLKALAETPDLPSDVQYWLRVTLEKFAHAGRAEAVELLDRVPPVRAPQE
jgi:hypothetical protein